WPGRQVAVLAGRRTVAMGEVIAIEGAVLRLRAPGFAASPSAIVVRDARRTAGGVLETDAPFAGERMQYRPAPEMAPFDRAAATGGPRLVGRVGQVTVALVNGVFGDPLLHLRLRHQRRSLLFDLGEGGRLPARIAHQVTDVFISHAHMDHIGGFLWLLRSRIGELPACRLYGPPGLAGHVEGLLNGILWDRVEHRGPRFEVTEYHGDHVLSCRLQAGGTGCREWTRRPAPDGVLLQDPAFRVRAVTLDHGTPVLAFAFEPHRQLNVRKDRLAARGLAPGPWLGELKAHLQAARMSALVTLPDGRAESAARLGEDLILVSAGKRLIYATDLADTAANRRRLAALAAGAHTLFCEASFRIEDADQARRTGHLTTRACAEIAGEAGVGRLVPFHFSRRYLDDPTAPYEEIVDRFPRTAVPGPALLDQGLTRAGLGETAAESPDGV
ncbi:MAG TPA: MBL fold metallo-hydrolase, partial [Gammaproteobacteria bacterium]|nr:MBL fold metallo-hydrolase [Gammaproteobacteria bacterium]